MYFVAKDFLAYNIIITVGTGHHVREEVSIGDGSIKIEVDFQIDKILFEGIVSDEVSKKASKFIDGGSMNAIYNDTLYHKVNEINKEEASELLQILSRKEEDELSLLEEIREISSSSNTLEFTEKLNNSIRKVEEMFKEHERSRYYDELLKQTNIYKNKQFKIAEKTGEKQLIYAEHGLPSEEHGMWYKEEYILPDGTTEKKEGWEY